MNIGRLLILNFIIAGSFTLQAFAQTNHPDSNTEADRPSQTDRVLLRDGSEKQHVTKKTKPKSSPEQKSEPKKEPGAGLPTDVD